MSQGKEYDSELRRLADSFKALRADRETPQAAAEPREIDPQADAKGAAWTWIMQHTAEFNAHDFDALPKELAEPLDDETRRTFREGLRLHLQRMAKR